MHPLEGIVVVALEQAVAGPYATRQLADLGARVIKIERPGSGDFARGYDHAVNGISSYFAWCNRFKESIALDLKTAHGAEALRRLLDRADVFLHNLTPGAVDRLGFAAERLRELHPRLIICQVSGYGPSGPYRDMKAYDLLIQCEAGLVSATGTEDHPGRAGFSAADIAAGMLAYSGILTALFARERNGRGTVVNVSMLEALGEWMGTPAYFASYSGSEPPRTGDRHPYIAPYGSFLSSGGERVFLAVQNDREWRRLCTIVLQKPEIADDLRFDTNVHRAENMEEMIDALSRVLGKWEAAEIRRRLDEAAIAHAHLNTVQELVDHPQLRARDRYREIDAPGGPIWALLPPVDLTGYGVAMGPVPRPGEHTDAILAELETSL